MSLNTKIFRLKTGATIPAIGLGTWLSSPGEVANAVHWALKAGYRHIDTAAIYNNEAEVGQGIKSSGVPRSEIFLTSKLWNSHHHPSEVATALDESLRKLGTDYLDLYLMHWPVQFASRAGQSPRDPATGKIRLSDATPISATWAAMEALVETGKVRAIGVSNFTPKRVEQLIMTAKIRPAVNQIELHPYLPQNDVLDWHRMMGIHVTAYSPLGNNIVRKPRVLDDAAVEQIAKDLGRSAAQVLISWAVMRGTSVLPKSVTKERIEGNFQVTELPKEALEKLNALDRGEAGRYSDPIGWGVDIFGRHSEEEVRRAAEDQGRKALASGKL